MSIAAVLAWAERTAARLAWLPPTLARLALGVVFLRTGWGKLTSLDQVTAFFTELGIPAAAIQAPMVALVELVGGVLLLLGLGTRFVAAPLAMTMVVAIATAQRGQIHGPADLFALVEFAYLLLLVWIAVAGAGPLSVDRRLQSAYASK